MRANPTRFVRKSGGLQDVSRVVDAFFDSNGGFGEKTPMMCGLVSGSRDDRVVGASHLLAVRLLESAHIEE